MVQDENGESRAVADESGHVIAASFSWDHDEDTGEGHATLRATHPDIHLEYEVDYNAKHFKPLDAETGSGLAQTVPVIGHPNLKLIFLFAEPVDENGEDLPKEIRITIVFDSDSQDITPIGLFRNHNAWSRDRGGDEASLQTDITDEYEQTLENIETLFTTDIIQRLRQYKILLVPGFLSNVVLDLGKIGGPALGWIRLGEYFDEQIDWLDSDAINIDNKRVEVESEGSIGLNAFIVGQDIRAAAAENKKVLIIGHSKGGLDTFEALRTQPDIRQHVAGFVPLQSPFWGSPVADWVVDSSVLGALAFKLLRLMGGSAESLIGLMPGTRRQYVDDNYESVYEALNSVPMFSVATWRANIPGLGWDSLLELTRNEMESRYRLNDGLVSLESARYPTADYVQIPNADHAVTVMYSSFIDFPRVDFMKTLLYMMLQKV